MRLNHITESVHQMEVRVGKAAMVLACIAIGSLLVCGHQSCGTSGIDDRAPDLISLDFGSFQMVKDAT